MRREGANTSLRVVTGEVTRVATSALRFGDDEADRAGRDIALLARQDFANDWPRVGVPLLKE